MNLINLTWAAAMLAVLNGCVTTAQEEAHGHLTVANGSKAVAVDPAIAASSTEALIDRLQDETEQGAATTCYTPWTPAFLPLDTSAQFDGGFVGQSTPVRSPVVTELVRRGVDSLPTLLVHLSDARPTKLTVGGRAPKAVASSGLFCDEYAYRYRSAELLPKGVNTLSPIDIHSHAKGFHTYTLKVGDLCYVAVGQIVNRGYAAVRFLRSPFGDCVVNSPIECPSLANAVRADWSGLTRMEHEQALRDDVRFDENLSDLGAGGMTRLFYYYPSAGREVADGLLKRTIVDPYGAWRFIWELGSTRPAEQARKLEGFRSLHGEVYFDYLQTVMARMAANNTPTGAVEKKLATDLISRLFVGLKASQSEHQFVEYYHQKRLILVLENFDWDGLDQTLLGLYRSAVSERPWTNDGQIVRFDLALACAKRLIHRGHGDELRSFFEVELRHFRSSDIDLKESHPDLYDAVVGEHPVFMRRIEQCEKLLGEL